MTLPVIPEETEVAGPDEKKLRDLMMDCRTMIMDAAEYHSDIAFALKQVPEDVELQMEADFVRDMMSTVRFISHICRIRIDELRHTESGCLDD